MEGQGRIFDIIIGEVLCDVAWCLGSGVVMLKESVMHRLMPKIEQQNKICVSIFKQFIWCNQN